MPSELVEKANFLCPCCQASTKYYLDILPSNFYIPGIPDWRRRLRCVNCEADFAESLSHPETEEKVGCTDPLILKARKNSQ